MSRIIYSDQANRDIVRLADFMQEIEPSIKQRVILTILEGIQILSDFPCIAKPAQDEKYKHLRELFIPFGGSGYSVLYEYRQPSDTVLIAAIRHTRESGYKMQLDWANIKLLCSD